MLFKFKQKPIVLDAFTVNPAAHDVYPVVPAHKATPDWWKNLPKNDNFALGQANMRMCPGFVNLYRTGFILKFVSDTEFVVDDTDDPELVEYSKSAFPHLPPKSIFSVNASIGHNEGCSDVEMLAVHPIAKRIGWAADYENFKVGSPWAFRCSKYIKFLMMQPAYTGVQSPSWFTPPGIIDFKYNHTVETQIMVNVKRNTRIQIEAGSPLCHIIPLTSEEVQIKTHLVDQAEFKREIKRYRTFGRMQGGYIKTVTKLEGGL